MIITRRGQRRQRASRGGKHARSERGQSFVEFALFLPIFILILAGLVDLGRGLQSYIVLTNAVREGASYGVFNPSNTTSIKAHVQNEGSAGGITISTGNITVSYPSGNSSGNPIHVQATYQFSTLLLSILGRPTITLDATAEMVIV